MKLIFQALAALILVSSCSKSNLQPEIPEPQTHASLNPILDPCPSELRPGFVPSELTANGCTNFLQFQFHGNFIFDSGNWTTEINCVQNPKNWEFDFFEWEDFKAVRIRVHYPHTIPADGEPHIYFSGNDFRLKLNAGDCSEFAKFDYLSGSGEGNNLAKFLIFLTPDFWDCEPQYFDFEFFVTGTFDFPVAG